MMMSLALPERRLLRVDLYPRVTVAQLSDPDPTFSTAHRGAIGRHIPLPDFITSASLELMLLASLLLFLTAILTVSVR